MKALYARPRKHTYNNACYFINKIYGGDGISVNTIGKNNGFDVCTFYKDGEMIAFYDEYSGDLWTTVQ